MSACPQCGHENSADSLYCWACGATLAGPPKSPGTETAPNLTELASAAPPISASVSTSENRFCENCGAVIPADAEFCAECGRSAKAGISPATAPDLSATAVVPPVVPLPAAQRYCENCGATIAPDADFCAECGRSAKAGISPATAPDLSAIATVPPVLLPPPAQRYCENCGAAVASEAEFCPNCGRSIRAGVSPATVATPPAPATAAAPAPVPADSRSRMKVLLAAVAGFLIVLAAGAYYFYGSLPRRVQPAPQTPPLTAQTAPAQPAPEPPPEQPPSSPAESTAAPSAPSTEATPEAPTSVTAPAPSVTPPAAPREHHRSVAKPAIAPTPTPEPQSMPVQETTQAAPPQPPMQAQPMPEQQPETAPVYATPVPPRPAPTPAPLRAQAPIRPVYRGPQSGWILWTGKLGKNETLSINGATASSGVLQGQLPGVPVNVIVDAPNIGFDEEPSPRNNWQRLVLRSFGKHSSLRIHWTVR